MTGRHPSPGYDPGLGNGADEVVRGGRSKVTKHPRKNRASTFLQIDEQYAIGADAHGWHILKKRQYKGAPRWEPCLWYSSLEACVNALADLAVRTSGAQSLARSTGRV